MKEDDDVLETTFCCDQALLDCGYIPGSGKFWALTSINTIEIINEESADLFTRITKVSLFSTLMFYSSLTKLNT